MLSRTIKKQEQEEEQFSKLKCISKSNDNITTLWKAYDKKRNSFVVIKKTLFTITSARFKCGCNELIFLKKLRKFNELEIFSEFHSYWFDKDSNLYVVMPFYENGDLCNYILSNSTGLSITDAISIFHSMLQAVDELHLLNICHGDISLENFCRTKEKNKVRLIDFGTAIQFPYHLENKNFKRMHAPPKLYKETYFAPEALCCKLVDWCKLDVFSLGVCLFTLIYGYPPFENTRPDNIYYKSFQTDISQRTLKNRKRFHFSNPEEAGIYWTLIQNMLIENPIQRVSIEEIKTYLAIVS